MNRKIVIICSVLALLLLGGIGFGFYKLFFVSDSDDEVVADSRGDAINAVPSDAVMICDFASLSDLNALAVVDNSPFISFLNQKSNLLKFVNLCADAEGGDNGAILSLHYSAKNTISFLFVLSFDNPQKRAQMKELIDDLCSGVIIKKYSGVTISKAVIPEISYAFYGNYLIASTSHVTVESSIRHLESRTSVMDNPLYSRMSKSINGKVIIHVNHQNIGKFFSGAINYDYLSYANFFSAFTSWSAFDLDYTGTAVFGAGKMINTKDVGNFSNTLALQKSQQTKVFDILPHTTEYVITMPMYAVEEYLNSYVSYLEAVKKINDYTYLNAVAGKRIGQTITPREWFENLDVQELAVASIPHDKGGEKVVLLKLKDASKMKLYKGYLPTLLGELFSPTFEEAFCTINDWIVVGSKSLVEKLAGQVANELFFSLKMYLNQTPAASVTKNDVSVLGLVNMSRCTDTLRHIVKNEYSTHLVKGIKDFNFNFLTFNVTNEGGRLKPAFAWYFENLPLLPQPPVAEITSVSKAVYDEVVVEVPKGPFQVKNFLNGRKNYLQQLDDNKIRLLDENKRGVWTIPFDDKLCGYVAQVDHYKNNKLQMVFCAGKSLYMLDRLGRWVKSYPVELPKGVVLGPVVYDFNKNKNYMVMVLHSDNTIGQYDIWGKPIESWSPVALSEKIKSMPELLVMDGSRYWIIRTGYQTIICDETGAPVVDFTRKKRLLSDTKVVKRSGQEVVVTNMEGKDVVLNLQTGSVRKL